MKSFSQFGIAAALLVAVSSASSFASTLTVQKETFAPVNNFHIPVGSHLAGGIDEATFNAVIDKMLATWTPFATAAGATLTFNRLWTDDTVNSSAEEHGKKWSVNAYGGLARHPLMTKDAMMMVFCHEMGHHLGGFPRMSGLFGSSWAADEGQADYFATMKCFRRMTQDDDNATIVAAMTIPESVKTDCASLLKDSKDIVLCERSAMIGLNLADILHALSVGSDGTSSEAAPDFATPDTSTVSTTNQSHPASQCRLDTYMNGSFCGVSYTEAFSKTDPITGACAVEKGDKSGYRPLCWYKPKN
jgi:hypothetical protein